MEFHEAADLFPIMEGADYEELKEDIRAHGQSEPIDVWRGKILDGRNRFRACTELGIMPMTRQVVGDIDPIAFVISKNLCRRHLSTSQRAMVGARAKVMYEAQAKARRREGHSRGGRSGGRGRPKQNETREDADRSSANLRSTYRAKASEAVAEAANVAPRTIEHASKIIANGTAELNEMVDTGKVKVSAAAAVATLPVPEQEEVVAQGPDAVKAKAKEVRESFPPMPKADPEEAKKRRIGENWHEAMHDLWMTVNSISRLGGIERLMKKWNAESKARILGEVRQISGVLAEWIEVLEGEER